ncbi:hypothetical protein ACTG9Q_27180 [Actinokineospora sp. 24-640]
MNETVVSAEEVSHHPASCRSRVALRREITAEPSAGADRESADTELAGPQVSTAAVRHSSAQMRSWLEDPIMLEVNAVTNRISWGWSGSGCVTPGTGARPTNG